jgi:hypothetical protein
MGASLAYGAAPDSLAGMVYHEESSTAVNTAAAFGLVMNSDGTSRGIYRASTYGVFTLGNPSDGNWSYRKTGENTAELILGGISEIRALNFSSDDRGTLRNQTGTSPIRTGRFFLSTASPRVPLVNCSNRAFVLAQGSSTTGFVVNEISNRVLIRAVGPGLLQFGVGDPLRTPTLRVYSGQTVVAQNSGWSSDSGRESLRRSAEHVGAFPLSSNSSDSAVLMILPPGAYTAIVSGTSESDSGDVLTEVYVLR